MLQQFTRLKDLFSVENTKANKMHLLLKTNKMYLQLLALQNLNLIIGSMKIQISLKIVTKPSKLFRKELKMEKILIKN